MTALIPIDDLGEEKLFDLVLFGAGIGYILLGVLGVLLIGQEYRHTTIRVTFTADPHRVRVMAAKAVLIVATGLVIGAVASVFSYAIGNAVLTSRGLDITLDGGTQTQALVGSTLLFALYGLIGLGVGAIIRAPAGAITFLVVWPIVVENIFSAFFPEVGRWLPFTAGIQLISTSETVDATEAMSPRAGGLWFARGRSRGRGGRFAPRRPERRVAAQRARPQLQPVPLQDAIAPIGLFQPSQADEAGDGLVDPLTRRARPCRPAPPA